MTDRGRLLPLLNRYRNGFAEVGTAPQPAAVSAEPSWSAAVKTGLAYYLTTSLVVLAGVLFGHSFVRPPSATADPLPDSVVETVTKRFDGKWYGLIAADGYTYDPARQSTVAFFPLYPLLVGATARATGLGVGTALLVVSHLNLAACFVLLARYCQVRTAPGKPVPTAAVLTAFGLLPPTFFFRMAYTESTFILLCLVVLYGVLRRWPLWALALGCGLATAARPVGVALVPLVLAQVYLRSAGWVGFAARAGALAPLCVGGLLAYAAFQYAAFGTPTAFSQTQTHWNVAHKVPASEKVLQLETFEPFWAPFDPDSRNYVPAPSVFSPVVFDRVFCLLAVAATVVGGAKRWLTPTETALCALLILIPYVTRGQEMCLSSMARFASTAFPVYLVYGRLLDRLPPAVGAAVLGACGLFLGATAALFTAGYTVI